MKKPYIVEFAGMPKSGKDRLIHSIHYHFRRQGYHVRILDESARRCPFDKAYHLEYTAWGLFSIMQRLLEIMFVADLDLVLVNRGPYDVEVMIEMLKRNSEASESEAKALKMVALLERFRDVVNLLVVSLCTPLESLAREQKNRIKYSEGRIMNPGILGLIYDEYLNCLESWRVAKGDILILDTERVDFLERAELVAARIGESLEARRLPNVVEGRAELARIVRQMAGNGQKITMVKGCYDVLHIGHINFLTKAKQLGDLLIVLLFDDASTQRRKGKERPRNPSIERAQNLLKLKCVDLVAIINEQELKELPGNLPVSAIATTRETWDGTAHGNVVQLERMEGISTTTLCSPSEQS